LRERSQGRRVFEPFREPREHRSASRSTRHAAVGRGPRSGARRWLLALAGGAALALAAALVDADTGARAWVETGRELRAAREENRARTLRTEALRRELEALEHQPFALERAIREELGLARPGELVVRFRRPR
jgi:cell division protein FtsB